MRKINFYLLFKKIISTPELFFLSMGLLFGGLFILIIPPFQTPDANVHFYRAFEVSELKIPKPGPNNALGSYLPASIRHTEIGVNGTIGAPGTPNQLAYNTNQKYDHHKTKATLFIPLNQNDKIFYPTSGTPNYVPYIYIPQALVIGIAKLFNAPVLLMVYLVSLTNLLMWITFVMISIKIIPWKKWTVVFICLLPTCIMQATSIGTDVLAFGSALIFVSMILRYATNKDQTITKTDYAVLLMVSALMVACKPVAVALLILVFLLDKNMISWVRKVIVMTLPVVIYLAWIKISSSVENATSLLQVQVFLHEPWVFLGSLFNTLLLYTPEGYAIITGVIGYFGWLDAPLPLALVVFGYVFLVFALVVNYESNLPDNKPLSRKNKIIITLSSLIYFFAVFLSMYLYQTRPESNFIWGVQGRYLIPLLFLAVPLLYSNSLRLHIMAFRKYIILSSIFLLALSVVTLIFRYYIMFMPTL